METSKIKGSQHTAYSCGALLMIYFLFPHLLLMPYVLITGKKHMASAPDWVGTLFWPVRALTDHVPAYRALIEAETELTGIN